MVVFKDCGVTPQSFVYHSVKEWVVLAVDFVQRRACD